MKVRVSNEPLELELTDAQFEDLKLAMQSRNPAHEVQYADGRRIIINTLTGATITAEPSRVTKTIPDPDPGADPDRTVAQLKEALDAAGVEYASDARKADLQDLAKQHDV